MDSIFSDLWSWSWWFSTVVVAIVINILSVYLKPWVDGALRRISNAYSSRTPDNVAKTKKEIAELVADWESCIDYMGQEMAHRSRALVWGIVAAIALLAYLSFKVTALAHPSVPQTDFWLRIGFGGATAPFLMFALRDYMEASRRRSVLLLVHQQRGQRSREMHEVCKHCGKPLS